MKKNRIPFLIITCESVFLLICLGALTVAMWRNHFLKYYAKEFAADAGYAEAQRHYARKELWLYEATVYEQNYDGSGPMRNDGDIVPAGKTETGLQVYYYLIFKDFPGPHREIQQAFVDGYNRQMRFYAEHPEWYDQCGFRIPTRELKTTNSPAN
jgi:hypothetical protein